MEIRRITRSMNKKDQYQYLICKKIKCEEQQENMNLKRKFIQKIKGSLKRVLKTNFKLQNKINRLESLISAAHDEIEEKDSVILELYQVNQSKKITQNYNNS